MAGHLGKPVSWCCEPAWVRRWLADWTIQTGNPSLAQRYIWFAGTIGIGSRPHYIPWVWGELCCHPSPSTPCGSHCISRDCLLGDNEEEKFLEKKSFQLQLFVQCIGFERLNDPFVKLEIASNPLSKLCEVYGKENWPCLLYKLAMNST